MVSLVSSEARWLLGWSPVCARCPGLTGVAVPRTVLLLNRSEVQSEFLSIAEKLSSSEPPQHSTLVLLLEHLYQANFGTRCDLDRLHPLLKVGWGSARPGGPRGAVQGTWLLDFLPKMGLAWQRKRVLIMLLGGERHIFPFSG